MIPKKSYFMLNNQFAIKIYVKTKAKNFSKRYEHGSSFVRDYNVLLGHPFWFLL